MKTFDEIITKLGGTVKAANALDESPSTISSWKARGIPSSYKDVLNMQKRLNRLGIKLKADELWPMTSEGKK